MYIGIRLPATTTFEPSQTTRTLEPCPLIAIRPPNRAHWPHVIFAILVVAVCSHSARAQTLTLDEPASPISVTFNTTNARMSATDKVTGAVWSHPATGGGTSISLNSATQLSDVDLVASGVTSNGVALTIQLALDPSTGELGVTLSADSLAQVPDSIKYPYAFHPADGSGYMVMPVFQGYVVPTTMTTWRPPSAHSRLEWFGGVDANLDGGWMMIADTAADMEISAESGNVGGQSRRGGAFKWLGSNANASFAAGRFSYDRLLTIKFFADGGYVTQAKRFREYAVTNGWIRTLAEKAAAQPRVDKLIGAPIIYLWGDGRSTAMLDGLSSAGIERALIQMSINHVDQNSAFPNQQFANGDGWANAVRAKGYVPGIYDIYAGYSPMQTQPPYNGFHYLWPTIANPEWVYRNADGTLDDRSSISNILAAVFARDTRLPQHISQFGLDAFFSDVVCAVSPQEDYDTTYGHFASRADDIEGRQALLAAVSVDHNRIAGVEQLKSWGVPFVHWAEGVVRLGDGPPVDPWNNNAYPEIMTDVKAPSSTQLADVLDIGFRVPLFDLVYHDCVVTTNHWHSVHNKLLYAWDFNDQFALLRGQAPILNLIYDGDVGSMGRSVGGAIDQRDNSFWDTRWTNPLVRDRVMATYESVCAWHRDVGYLEMTDHRVLSSDFSVQQSEFSDDGGASGKGIVVNFGVYDGAFGSTGSTWSGVVRDRSISVPVGAYATYAWESGDLNCDGVLDVADVAPFVTALTDIDAYDAGFPSCTATHGDMNTDGALNAADVGAFVSALLQ